jgi:hypothetical protein
MNVIASNMGRQQTPATMQAHLLNRLQNSVATDLVEVIGSLIHQFPLRCGARGIHFQDRGSRHIVLAVDGAGFTAVQVVSVSGKHDQVDHGL